MSPDVNESEEKSEDAEAIAKKAKSWEAEGEKEIEMQTGDGWRKLEIGYRISTSASVCSTYPAIEQQQKQWMIK